MAQTEHRLIAGVVATVVMLAAICAGVVAHTARRYYDELSQELNSSIAMYVDREAPLLRDGKADQVRLEQIARQAMVVNPLAQVYVLNVRGTVIGGGSGQIDLAPVHALLAGERGPIYGMDPANARARRIFSAHAIREANITTGYIYVVLGGARTQGLAADIASSRVLVVALLLLTLIVASASALAISIDRRFRNARQQVASLRDLDQNRRTLFESIGHDLRTPLTAACGYLEVLERDAATMTAEHQAHYIQVIRQHCQRLARLVSQVFRLARLESPVMAPRWELLNLQELAHDVAMRFERDAASPQRRVLFDLDRTAPLVRADCELLETVIENLLDNALRHGGPHATVRLSVVATPACVTVQVKDNGGGMDQAAWRAVSGTACENPVRRGLGLIIVDRALRLLGSELQVASGRETGTTMSFHLAVMNS